MSEPNNDTSIEAIERAVHEIEALEAIYGATDDDDAGDGGGSFFRVCSHDELTWVRQALDDGTLQNATDIIHRVPNFSFELSIPINEMDEESSSPPRLVTLYCVMPAGYPVSKALVVTLLPDKATPLTKAQCQVISSELSKRANEMIGQEAVMELVQELKDCIESIHTTTCGEPSDDQVVDEDIITLGRRWIWVHHITDPGRKKSIVQEARELNLGGYLKAGYPGVCVVEGIASSCDDFVAWIKGNKSRPGGFGRNWGHHVRGELTIDERRLPDPFEQILEEDLAVLSDACKRAGLEAEFKEFVMQHKAKTAMNEPL